MSWEADCDWKEAFAYAEDPMWIRSDAPATDKIGRAFAPTDVTVALRTVDGENDEASWIGLFQCGDWYLFLDAWCDYTGWDCQAGGYAMVSRSLDWLWRWGIGQEQRTRLVESGFNPGIITFEARS